MPFKNDKSRRAAFANMNSMGGKKYNPSEPVFFADDFKDAVKYAKEKHIEDPKHSMLPETIHKAKDQNPNTDMTAWTGYKMKPMSKREIEYKEFSPEAKRGINKFSNMSSSEMDHIIKKYESQTSRVARHVLNKEDFYSWIDATQLNKKNELPSKQSEALKITKSMKEKFGYRMFTKQDIPTISKSTMDALVQKGHFEETTINNVHYYKLVEKQ